MRSVLTRGLLKRSSSLQKGNQVRKVKGCGQNKQNPPVCISKWRVCISLVSIESCCDILQHLPLVFISKCMRDQDSITEPQQQQTFTGRLYINLSYFNANWLTDLSQCFLQAIQFELWICCQLKFLQLKHYKGVKDTYSSSHIF